MIKTLFQWQLTHGDIINNVFVTQIMLKFSLKTRSIMFISRAEEHTF